jgi:hypothetical protein
LLNHKGIEGFFVLVNKIRPNHDGANDKDESRFRKGNQIIILGSKREAKDVFVNNLNPFIGNINTAHFCPNVKTFMTRLMTDSDPADSNDGNLVTTSQRSREEKYNEMKKQLAAAVETIEQLKKTKDKTKKQLTAALKTIEELKKKNP